MKVSNVGISRRERGRVLQETVAKEENAQEPMVDSLVHGIQKVGVSEAERRVREGV